MGDYTDLAWTASTSNNPWETAILNGAVKTAKALDSANSADSRENPIERYQPIIRRNTNNR